MGIYEVGVAALVGGGALLVLAAAAGLAEWLERRGYDVDGWLRRWLRV